VKILNFLKGGTMKIQFNEAQLSRPQRENLLAVLEILQCENQNEIEVTAFEFPTKLKVKLDDDIEMLLGWNAESESYSGISTKTEPEPEPEPELAPTLEGIKTLARDLFANVKAMNSEQRQIFWAEISSIVARELL